MGRDRKWGLTPAAADAEPERAGPFDHHFAWTVVEVVGVPPPVGGRGPRVLPAVANFRLQLVSGDQGGGEEEEQRQEEEEVFERWHSFRMPVGDGDGMVMEMSGLDGDRWGDI